MWFKASSTGHDTVCTCCVQITDSAEIVQSMEGIEAVSREPLTSVMKAVRLHKFGGPDVLQLDTNVKLPSHSAKQVVAVTHCALLKPWRSVLQLSRLLLCVCLK